MKILHPLSFRSLYEPNKEAIVYSNKKINYRELYLNANSYSKALKSIIPKDKKTIIFKAHKSWSNIFGLYALTLMDLTICPISEKCSNKTIEENLISIKDSF